MLLISLALAADPISWDHFPLQPARPDAQALGPDWMMVGPQGPLIYDAVDHQLYTLTGQHMTVPMADDGLILPDQSILLRNDRQVWWLDRDGELRSQMALPDLVPPGPLKLEGTMLYVEDVFLNLHPAFSIRAHQLIPATDPTLRPNPRPVQRAGLALSVGGKQMAQCQQRCGGYLVGDWLIVEEHGAQGIVRYGIHTGTHQRVELSVGPRLYAPSRDLAVGPDGHLWWMQATAGGLIVEEISP